MSEIGLSVHEKGGEAAGTVAKRHNKRTYDRWRLLPPKKYSGCAHHAPSLIATPRMLGNTSTTADSKNVT